MTASSNTSIFSRRILAVSILSIISTFASVPPVIATPTSPKVQQPTVTDPNCSTTDEGVVSCNYCAPGDAPALIFPRGPEYDTSTSIVCLKNLGIFNSESGVKSASNFDSASGKYLLNGKYLRTEVQTQTPNFSRFAPPANDFRINPNGISTADARQSTVWSSEAHLYYYISSYRTKTLTDGFINSLGLAAELKNNLQNRQFRPDLQGLVNARLPWVFANELISFSPWSNLVAENNLLSPTKKRTLVSDSLDSLAFDPEYVVGQYTGVVSNWLTAGNAQWPQDPNWGSVGNTSWKTDVRPAIVEGFKLWNAYRSSANTELYKYAQRVMRRWSGYACGGINQVACNKGWKIDNAMMYLDSADPALNNPTNQAWPAPASDDTLLFPYGTNFPATGVRSGNGVGHFGPTNGALGGMFIGALFYDLSKEVGLGVVKADMLFWKTISLIDPSQSISMTTFGQKIQEAARALFPTTANPALSWYEQDIVDVLSSRGIKMNGATDFLTNLPPAIGTAANPGPGTMNTVNAAGFGSSIPESQKNSSTGYNFLSYFINGFNVTTPGTQYATYQFYKYSRYGACDSLDLTNGTINSASTNNPIMNYDGSMATSFRGKTLGNTLVMSPGSSISFMRRRQSCVSEEDGYYPEDIRATGFRVLKVIPNGFTFAVQRLGNVGSRIAYKLSIVDPSLTLSGPNTGAATYAWTFTEFNGATVQGSGQVVTYNALKDQPFTISVTRTRGAQNDNLTLRERGNDLDRNSGKQFNQDFWNPGYLTGFDTIVDRRLVEGHGSYNSALNPVGGAFGVQGRRWTTPPQIVQPIRFSTVSHGLGSGSNQNGPYNFDQAVYYNACIWGSRDNVTTYPGCHMSPNVGDYEQQIPFSQTGIVLGDPFAIVTSGAYPAYLWTVNYPSEWRLNPSTEYYFGSHISASVVNNGYSYNVCSYAPAAWDGSTPGNAADRSDWLAGANWSGQGGAPMAQTMRDYLDQAGSVSNCTFAAYKFEGKTVSR